MKENNQAILLCMLKMQATINEMLIGIKGIGFIPVSDYQHPNSFLEEIFKSMSVELEDDKFLLLDQLLEHLPVLSINEEWLETISLRMR